LAFDDVEQVGHVGLPRARDARPAPGGSGAPAGRKSSGEVVIECWTAVDGSVVRATSAKRSSWQMITRLPESERILASSRSRSIGLHGTITAPHFHTASTVTST
jgi:hypothetical protein